MFKLEESLLDNADKLAHRASHGVDAKRRAAVLSHHNLSAEQGRAVEAITAEGDLKSLVGVAGSGKSTTLAAMREVWEKEGYTAKGAALAGIAAESLQVSSGIHSRTLASYELSWSRGRDPLGPRDILVIDEAGMLGTRQLERVLEVAQKAHAKVILVGDPHSAHVSAAAKPNDLDAKQQAAAERWAARQKARPSQSETPASAKHTRLPDPLRMNLSERQNIVAMAPRTISNCE
jgi:ATP-dependent exoDNAse (exonuclease V) alpha subunit